MALLTVSTLVLIVYGLLTRRYDRALALAGVTSAGAALVVGPIAIPTFYAVALALFAVLAVRYVGERAGGRTFAIGEVPGAGLFIAFFAWAVLVTLVAPIMFSGMETVGADAPVLVAGAMSPSNIAQIVYLGLSIFVVLLFAHTAGVGPQTIGLLLATSVLLSAWRYLGIYAGVPFPEGVFDNSPTFNYIETEPGGAARFRGIYPEPAALAAVAVSAVVYSIARARDVTGLHRVGHIALAAIATFLGLVSTSASFVVVGVVMVGVVLLVSFVGFISAQTRYQPAASFTFLAAVVVAAYVAAPAYEYVNGILEDKLQSSSFTDRSGSDELSYAVFLDTFGWGVGLGNGRASSFVATLFSTVGFVGVLLFLAAVAAILGPALRIRAARPVIWVLAASLIGKVVSGPDLSSPDGLMWMCLGVLASMVLVDRRAREHAAAGARAQADGTEPLAAATSPPLAGLRRPRPRHAPAHR